MKPKLKEIIFDAFAVLGIGVGFSVHGLPSLCFLIIGIICGAFALYFTLLNHRVHGATRTQARNWGLLFLAVFTLGAAEYWREYKLPINAAESRPHFILSLQLGDSLEHKILLTNDFLFSGRFVNAGALPNGDFMVKNIANGCLVIPVQEGESNKVFNFFAENDSLVKVADLEVSVGFPKESECLADSSWRNIKMHLTIPDKWRFDFTNLQFFSYQVPWPVFPTDSVEFPPITNSCNTAGKGGFLSLNVRSTDFETMISANIIFIPTGTKYFEPFVTLAHFDTNGLLHISPSPKEYEDSQK